MATTRTKSAAITVDQYERMIDAGTISEDEPVELIEGRLVSKMTKRPDRLDAPSRSTTRVPKRLAVWLARPYRGAGAHLVAE